MKGYLFRPLLISFGVLALQLLSTQPASAVISNGMAASGIIGQYDANNVSALVPIFTKGGSNNSPSRLGLNLGGISGASMVFDATNHRLFLSDGANNRVLVFSLNNDNTLTNKIPVNVLGQPDFNTNAQTATQSGMKTAAGLAYDSANQRLFVPDLLNHRVLVFNLSGGISNGMNASNVLGQVNFTSIGLATTQSGMNFPTSAWYDSGSQRLFIADRANNRVLQFDLSGGITDGMNAVHVLGQVNFTSGGAATTQVGMSAPQGPLYDAGGQRLFVADSTNNRVLVFSLAAGLTDGMNAAYVFGQTDFTSAGAAITQTGLGSPLAIAYDTVAQHLFVTGNNANRVVEYDISATATTNMNAVHVLGQTNFTNNVVAATQAGMNVPRGLGFDATNHRLYVGETTNNRVTIFDVASSTLIADGPNAIDEMGQYDANSTDLLGTAVVYTKGALQGTNNGPNRFGFNVGSFSMGIALDATGHRLFVGDSSANRVLVFALNNDNTFQDYAPDFILGEPDFNTNASVATQVGMNLPVGVTYDAVNHRLFVGDSSNNRVLVFDLSGAISNGMNAAYVLGQANFTSGGTATTQTGMSAPRTLTYDSSSQRLFVGELSNNRVLVFSLAAGISNGMAASYVLGQANFTSGGAATTQVGMSGSFGVAYDASTSRLFVSDGANNRVLVYDAATTTNGQNAAYVLGQANFTSGGAATTQTGLSTPRGVSYDATNRRLFVGDGANNRVLVYDAATATTGMAASYVLGQSGFASNTAATAQTGMSLPRDLVYDSASGRLYVADNTNNRLLIFDVTPPSGGAAHCPAYHLALSRPLGGESWKAGNTENVLWTLDGCQTVKMTVSLTTDGGLTYTPISDISNFSSGAYAWKVPDVTTSNARINLTAFGPSNTVLATATSGTFTITGSSTNSPMNPPVTSTTSTPEIPPPTPPPAGTGCTPDTLIKASTPAVYWCGFDLKRHVFPNEAIFYSWYHDFKGVITMSDSQLASVPLGRNVTFHPGILLKLQTDPKVYVVGDKEGLLHPIPDEATAKRLYGPKWNTLIKDLSEAFFTDYRVGEPAP